MAEAKKNKATSEEAQALAERDLASTTKELANDEKDLADLSTDCQQKASDWSESQTSRAAELQALVDAKKIIEEMTGGGASRAYGLLQASDDSDSTQEAGSDVVAKLRQVQKTSEVQKMKPSWRMMPSLSEPPLGTQVRMSSAQAPAGTNCLMIRCPPTSSQVRRSPFLAS